MSFGLLLLACRKEPERRSIAQDSGERRFSPDESRAAAAERAPADATSEPSADDRGEHSARHSLELTASALRAALLSSPVGNLAIAPGWALGTATDGANPGAGQSQMDIELDVQFAVQPYERRFVGLDGSVDQVQLAHLEFPLATAKVATAQGAFEVYELPLADAKRRLVYIELPRRSASALARVLDADLISTLLGAKLSAKEIPRFPMFAGRFDSPHQSFSELTTWPSTAPSLRPLDKLVVGAKFSGPSTALFRLRNASLIARPGWFILKNRRTGVLEAVIALHAAPLPG